MYTGKHVRYIRQQEKNSEDKVLEDILGWKCWYFPFALPDPLSILICILEAELPELHQWVPLSFGCWLSFINEEQQKRLERGLFSCLD